MVSNCHHETNLIDVASHVRISGDAKAGAVILYIIIVLCSLCTLYLCLKNRGRLCPRKDGNEGRGESVPNKSGIDLARNA